MEMDQPERCSSGTGESAPIADSKKVDLFSPMQSDFRSMLEVMENELLMRSRRGMNMGEKRGEEEKVEEDDKKRRKEKEKESILRTKNCKNLMSERKRRRRLNQQLLELRSIVPCVTKMDKQSILTDATTYIRNLHKEIAEVEKELSIQDRSQLSAEISESDSPSSNQSRPSHESPIQHRIYQLEVEAVDHRTFIIKVTFKRTQGAAGQVQRLIENLECKIFQSWTHAIDAHQMITTTFVNVKQRNVTADVLKAQISEAAFNFGMKVAGGGN